jgi:nitroreductase
MDLLEGLRGRKSIRGFLNKKVPREIIEEILIDSQWAPSASNQQPWKFHVLSGEPLIKLCSSILAAHEKEKKSYDPSKSGTIPKELVDRTRALFKSLRPFIGNLEDEEQRGFIEKGSFRFYGAPVVVFISINKNLPENRLMDIGMAAENLMLSAYGRGLGTCAIALALLYDDIINRGIGIRDDYKTVICIALGYPDRDFSVNGFRSSREEIEKVATWDGF